MTVSSIIRLPPLPTIRDILKLYKLTALKRLSQNFLLDERLSDKIIKSAGKINSKDNVIEIGPGPGGLTRSILKRLPSKLILIEKDERFLPALDILKDCIKSHGTDIDIYQSDILKFSIGHAINSTEEKLYLIGNLPFSISTRLLINWLEDLSLRREAFIRSDTIMLLTFQKEVAERICADIGDDQRCRLSVMSQIWTKPCLKFIIPGKAFIPKPKVDVGVVKLIPLKQPKTDIPFKIVEKVLRHTFSMRQKYCLRGYGTLFPEDERLNITHRLFNEADVDPMLRPFQLSVDEYIRLARVYFNFIQKNPEIAEYNYRAQRVKTSLIDSNNI